MNTPVDAIAGDLTAPDFHLPTWAQDRLWIALWDRDRGPEHVLASAAATGPRGAFRLDLDADAQAALCLTGYRPAPQHVVSVGWGQSRDPVLANLPWPADWAARKRLDLGWDGQVTLIGHVEQIHYQEAGGLLLAVLELSGYAAPVTYCRLPPLPASGKDRHGLDADRRLDDAPEQVAYVLLDAESPLATVALDALVSSLRVVCIAGLGPQEGDWHAVVTLPLLLEALTIVGP